MSIARATIMRFFRLPATLAVVCTFVFGSGVFVEARAEKAVFDIRVTGIRAGTLELDSRMNGDRYEATGRIEPTGIVRQFAKFGFDGTAQGRLSRDGNLSPEVFFAKSRSPRAERETRIEWAGDTPSRVSVVPPRSSSPDPDAQKGTLDPISAALALLGDAPTDRVCNATVDVFDGSRRSRYTLGPIQKDGKTIICRGVFERIEGEAHSMSGKKSHAFDVEFRDDGQGVARFQKLGARTRFGPAVIERQN